MIPVEAIPMDARRSLADHVAALGAEIRLKYGPTIGWAELMRIMTAKECVRYPCELAFDAGMLHPSELAWLSPRGEHPQDGFVLQVHPHFAQTPERVPYIALYQLVLVNYGVFARPEDAEILGAAALGLDQDTYYAALCRMADELDLGNRTCCGSAAAG